MAGPTLFEKIGMQTPDIMHTLQEKKFLVCLVAFLVGNMIRGQLLATGAFEIYFDEELVFSKLKTGSPPSEEMISHLVSSFGI